MSEPSTFFEKIQEFFRSPIRLTAIIGTITAIVGFVILFGEHFYLASIVIIVLGLGWLLSMCWKLAFSKTPPLIEGGRGVYVYPQARPYALTGIVIIPVLMFGGIVYLFRYGQPIVSQAFLGTFTPMPTNTFTPTLTSTLTASPTLPPPADSLYYLFVLDASARMTLGFDGSETKWNDLQASALNHLIYGLPERANYGLIVLGGNLVNSTVSCEVPNQQVVTFGNSTKMTLI